VVEKTCLWSGFIPKHDNCALWVRTQIWMFAVGLIVATCQKSHRIIIIRLWNEFSVNCHMIVCTTIQNVFNKNKWFNFCLFNAKILTTAWQQSLFSFNWSIYVWVLSATPVDATIDINRLNHLMKNIVISSQTQVITLTDLSNDPPANVSFNLDSTNSWRKKDY